MYLSKAIEGMILQESGGGKSGNTILAYRYGLNKLIKYLGSNIEIENITKEDLQKFFRYLRTDTDLCEASIAVVWRGVRIMFRWASEELKTERIDKNIPCPKSVSKVIMPYTEKELYQLLDSIKKGKNQKRDVAVIMLLLDTGMRIGELSRLRVYDYDEENKKIMIRPKGTGHKSFPRIIPLSDQTCSALWKYLATRNTLYDNDRLFLTNQGRPVDRDSMRKMCVRAGKRAGIKNAGPHKFRHTFCTQYLRNGGDVFTLKNITGIKSDKIIATYVEISQIDIASRHRAASPVTNWRL